MLERFRESSLYFGGNLIDESLCGRNVDQDPVVILLEDLFDRVEPRIQVSSVPISIGQ